MLHQSRGTTGLSIGFSLLAGAVVFMAAAPAKRTADVSLASLDLTYSLCQYGWGNVWEWGAEQGIEGNSWRTTGDITDTWESMNGIGFRQVGNSKYASPGHWNDPDMLVIGKVGWGPRLRDSRLAANDWRVLRLVPRHGTLFVRVHE